MDTCATIPPYPRTRRLVRLLNDIQEKTAAVVELHRRAEVILQALVDAQGPSPEQLEAMLEGYQVARNAKEFGVREDQAESYKEFLEEVRPGDWDATAIAKAVTGTALIGVGAVVVVPAITVAALGAVGFTSAGVAAGSIAAGLQSSMFGALIPAGSWFATCQAAAMGGIAVAAPINVVAGTAAMLTGGTVLATNGGKADEKDENHLKDVGQKEATAERDASNLVA
ncbi:hypothetical protein FRB99_004010 [Tulasnella sp. 403]|nr:hypothetical protein FRB99_004010 [Tulasnella sp. 403]